MDEQLRQSKARIAADIQEHFDETLAMMERANLEEKRNLEEMLKKKEEELQNQKKLMQDAAADGDDERWAYEMHELKVPMTMLDYMMKHRKLAHLKLSSSRADSSLCVTLSFSHLYLGLSTLASDLFAASYLSPLASWSGRAETTSRAQR